MKINVAEALNKQGSGSFHYEYKGVPELDELSFAGPLTLSADYCLVEGGIRVKGSFHGELKVMCTRCLEETTFPLEIDFEEIFFKTAPEDDEQYTLEEKVMNLEKMVYDAIVLNIPQSIVCSENCKGLCSNCGANLNKSDCNCSITNEVDVDNPFAKLKDLYKS